MTGKGHLISGACLLVINDNLIKIASNALSSYTDVNIFSTYRDYISRMYLSDELFKTPLGTILGIIQPVVFLAAYLFGCLLPDVDSPKSILGKHFHIPVKHRTWTHTIWIVLLLFFGSLKVIPLFWISYGYLVHLLVDAFSRGGVCFLYPITRYRDYPGGAHVKSKHIFKIYTPGGKSEDVLCKLMIFSSIAFMVFNIVTLIRS